jgi:chromatin remodeling complex protein RSC6
MAKATAKKAAKKPAAKKPAAKKPAAKKPAAKKPAVKKAVKKAAPKKAVKKVVKKAAPKKAAKAKTKRKPNPQFMKPMNIGAALQPIVGAKPLPRTEVTKKLWAYIKKNNLQNPSKKTEIIADANLKAVFGGKKAVDMFQMTKLVNAHLS